MNANEAEGDEVEDAIGLNYQELSAVRLPCLCELCYLKDSLKQKAQKLRKSINIDFIYRKLKA